MDFKNLLNRRYSIFIYIVCFLISVTILWQGRNYGLFPAPHPGMDQENFLRHAHLILQGNLPGYQYKLCPSYTLLMTLFYALSGGKIIIMRILQIALCSLIPVVIYKLCRRLRCSFQASQIAALIFCFYGPAILISISFLRAAPLGLCFLSFVYMLVRAFFSKKWYHYLISGLLAGICILSRENFLPVVLCPAIMCIFPMVRKRVNWRQAGIYFCAIAALTVPVIIYNFIRFRSPEIIPGNVLHIFNFYHGEAATASSDKLASSMLQRIPSQINLLLSSYELPNSLSFFAHSDIISLLGFLIIPFNLLLAGTFVALFLDFKNKRTLFIGGMAAAYFMTLLFFTLFYRFRIPGVPLLCVLAGIAIHRLCQTKHYWKQITSILIAILFTYFTYSSPNKLRTASERRSVIKLLIDNHEYTYAETLIDELIIDKKPLNKIHEYLMVTLYKNGNKQEFKRLYDKYRPIITINKKVQKK